MSVRARSTAVAVLAIAVLVMIPGIASAHAERSVGPFDLEIGFLGEPAYVGVRVAATETRLSLTTVPNEGVPTPAVSDAEASVFVYR